MRLDHELWRPGQDVMTPVDWSMADLQILARHAGMSASDRRFVAERFAGAAVIVADGTLHMLIMREGGK